VSAFPGDYLTYYVSVRNTVAKTNATLSLPLPAGVAFVSASGSYLHAGATLPWDFATLPACSVTTRKVRVRILDAVSPGTVLAAQASVTSDQGAGEPSGTVQTLVEAVPEPVRIPAELGLDNDSQEGPDPVMTGVGNFYWHRRLFSLPGKTMGIDFSVTYNALDTGFDIRLDPCLQHRADRGPGQQ
jgi:uncharacterized repeat protein (TIGR01451 family)